jgi:hypothetical protein
VIDPEPLSAVLARLVAKAQANATPPPKFRCAVCEDYGLVWVRRKAPEPFNYWFFDSCRCLCRAGTWGTDIPTYLDRMVRAEEVFNLRTRGDQEQADWEARKERDAIQQEGKA